MGTNFYWRDRPCEHCGRYDEVHVGKSMHTWRAWHHRLLNEEQPDWGYTDESPFGFPVLTLEDWRRVFTERIGELHSEYGHVVADPLAWLASAHPWTPNPEDGRYWLDQDIERGDGWLDPQGFRFYAREFS